MDMSELLSKLENVRKNGDGYSARCPAHDDTRNSLSIAEQDGKILLFCHAGCKYADILKALNVDGKGLASNCKTPKSKRKFIRERVWDIVDSSGQVIAKHHRKDYDTGKPKPGKEIWWEPKGTKTSELPLYGLEWLMKEPADSARDIIICEGEPAADALHEAGYLALATVTGAGGTPSKASLAPLLGRKGRIILWPDNDKVGRDHMQRIANRLHEMGIKCFLLNWPEAPDKGDAVDFFMSGGDVNSLLYNINLYVYIRSGQADNEAKRDKNGTINGTSTMENEPRKVSRFEGLAQRIRAWVEGSNGWFETRELDSDLGIHNPTDKENRKKVMQRLREQGVIEAHPKLNKQWRFINTRVTSLDFKVAQKTGSLPIKWPLGIEKYVNLFPGNLAVVAGSPNAGKTALLLNFIYLNDSEFPIYYFCSEMGAVELRDRLEQFPGMDIDEWKFKPFERASEFADVIVPDAVNVVDYLEMTDELYNVNKHLTAIHQKLNSGIAIVAIQKKIKADYGRGQEFSLEKPKLYLSLDAGRLKIIKGKSWAKKGINPNGLRVDFKINDGCILEETSQWTAGER